MLLKERNMLLTMEHAYREAVEAMPNQERLDKVDMSMENLEEVVRERNRAYYELEVGGSGEVEREIVEGPFGLDEGYWQVQRNNGTPFPGRGIKSPLDSRRRSTTGRTGRTAPTWPRPSSATGPASATPSPNSTAATARSSTSGRSR